MPDHVGLCLFLQGLCGYLSGSGDNGEANGKIMGKLGADFRSRY